jgi:hypothetical protein
MTTVPEALRACADTYEERNAIYGDSYKELGKVMLALFPAGVHLKTIADFNRFGCFFEMINKMQRYSNCFHNGGHQDSTHDISVYSQMLEELDREASKK